VLCIVDVADLDTEEGVRQPALLMTQNCVRISEALESSNCSESRLRTNIDTGRVCDQDCKMERVGLSKLVCKQDCKVSPER
jgi:hypothetical protein